MANVQIRVDEDMKKQSEEILNDLGLNMSTAVKMFLSQVIIEQGIPFQVKRKSRLEIGVEQINNGEVNKYDTVEDFSRSILNDTEN